MKAKDAKQPMDKRHCRKCGGEMKLGRAIENTLTGIGDFNDSDTAVTLSAGGPGKLVDCLKCTNCGWSVTR